MQAPVVNLLPAADTTARLCSLRSDSGSAVSWLPSATSLTRPQQSPTRAGPMDLAERSSHQATFHS